jgi:transposase-like protein
MGPPLPPADTIRWSPRRKAQVAQAVIDGSLSNAEACGRYQLSQEEITEWIDGYSVHGKAGLYATRRQPKDLPPAEEN